MNKIILFDLDGTLIDSTSAILDSFKYSFKTHNSKVPDSSLIKAQIGHTLEDMFIALGVESSIVDLYVNSYKERYSSIYLEQTTLLPFAKEAVLAAYDFALLGIVTTKSSTFLPKLLSHLGINDYFSVLVGRNDVLNPKPNPEPVNLAISKLDANSDRNLAFMIGDTHIDALAAKSASINALSVTCGYENEISLRKYNDKIFKDPLQAVLFAKDL